MMYTIPINSKLTPQEHAKVILKWLKSGKINFCDLSRKEKRIYSEFYSFD